MTPHPSLALRAKVFVVALICAGPTFGQPLSIDPPLVGRPDGFSNIVGKYDIQVSAEPTDVRVEEPITLRVRIIGSGPEKYEPDRKHLDLFPNWDNDFYVQEMRDEHRMERDKMTWLFVYRLKPKNVNVKTISGITLVYYNPSIVGKKKFVTVPADPIDITVKSKPADPGPVVTPSAVPDSFYSRASSAEVLAPPLEPTGLGAGLLGVVLLGVPCVCLVGALILRRIYPAEPALLDRRRSRAAQQALAKIRGGSDSPWSVMCGYLRARFDYAAQDATPREAAKFLKRRGFALERCAQAEAFLQACDAVQFTGNATMPAKTLADEAARLIQALEADPCVR